MRTDIRGQAFDPRGGASADIPGVGAKLRVREVGGVQTLSSGATVTFTGLIPANTWCWGVVVEVLELIGGTLASFDVGDGSDADRWGAAVGLTAGTRTTSDDFTAADSMGFFGVAAVNVVLDADGANTFDGTGLIKVFALVADITSNVRRGQFS